MALIETDRKSRILSRAQFGCLRHVHAINVTRGCEFGCVYCYARGYPEAPGPGEGHLYRNLPEKLTQELDSARRRTTVDWVLFNTASDSFQTHPKILDTTYRVMQVLLERSIGLSFLTKGWIPDRFMDLFSRRPGRVSARIGMVSLSPRYRELFEPHTATVDERLKNIDRLRGIGMDVEVRIDPIIPFYTDDEPSIQRLYEALAARDVRTVSLSYLHLRPAILHQLERELPRTESGVLGSCFESQPWRVVGTASRSKLIPRPLRRKGYDRFMRLSEAFGMRPLICACKNPDMPADLCSTGKRASRSGQFDGESGGQLTLFPC